MIKVYIIDMFDYEDFYEDDGATHPLALNDEEFIDVAETQGNVYTLEGFQIAFNEDEVSSSNSYIRIIETNDDKILK